MAKLYFRFGTVGSAKSLNLLAVAHNYRSQDKKVLVVKPKLDTRFGADLVRSRAGLEVKADILADASTQMCDFLAGSTIDCILVDEVQFLPGLFIDQLRQVATYQDIPVICYGLRTDFRRNLFEGSKRLLELADSFEEVKTTCSFCNKKAIYNLRLVRGKATLEGPSVDLGADEKYKGSCARCYDKHLFSATKES